MRSLTLFLILILIQPVDAQDVNPFQSFGNISKTSLERKIYAIDSNASAVVLSDIGRASIEGNSKGWFSLHFRRHKVVHILNKNGYHEADVEIPLYDDGKAEEKLKSIKAITYNLENGRVVQAKLDKHSIFKEAVNKNLVIRKFTMPNVKEGSIIEYEYELSSDFIHNLDPWYFQGPSPVLWSAFNLSLPQFFSYGFISYGYKPFFIEEKKDRVNSFMVMKAAHTGPSERYNFTAGVSDYKWVSKDLPELKEENFTSTLKNHIARLEFQLASYNPPLSPRSFRTTWPMLTQSLLENEDFSAILNANQSWLRDEIEPLTGNLSSGKEKAKKIFEYTRDQFTCTNHNTVWPAESLKNIFKSKKGSVADINLALVAMLRQAGLKADPVILSTADHGYVNNDYPLITDFNYLVCLFTDSTGEFYLDASHPRLGFGKLLPGCYNGHARVVNQDATLVELNADSVVEKKLTTLVITTAKPGLWMAGMKQKPGYFASYNIRNRIGQSGMREYFEAVQRQYGVDVTIQSPYMDSVDNFEEALVVGYEMELRPAMQDILYINPMFGEGYRSNPFRLGERYYPVEMPYAMDETFILTMEVPAGYEVDELPKQMIAKFDEAGQTFFEYLIALSGNTISLRSRIKINRTVFMPEEYETLRQFFNLIVSKQNEQVVFRKVK